MTIPTILFNGLAFRLNDDSLECAPLLSTKGFNTKFDLAAAIEDEWTDVDLGTISEVEQFQARRFLKILRELRELDTITGAYRPINE